MQPPTTLNAKPDVGNSFAQTLKATLPGLAPYWQDAHVLLAVLAIVAVLVGLWMKGLTPRDGATLLGIIFVLHPALIVWLRAHHASRIIDAVERTSLANDPRFVIEGRVLEAALTDPAIDPTAGSAATVVQADPGKPPGSGAGVGPKLTLLLLAAFGAGLLGGCAQTTFYDRATGKAIARFQGDMTQSHYKDGGTSWDVASVTHSTATLAQGSAAANVISATGSAVASGAVAVGSSGLFPKAAAVALPAVTQVVTRPAVLNAK